MIINKIEVTPYQLTVGIVPSEESAMLLRLISPENQAIILSRLIKISEGGFPGIPQAELKGYPSLELFLNPYKKLGDILMDLAAFYTAGQIESLVEAISKQIPGFEDEIRAYMVCFEDISYLSDLEMQTVIRREGLNPFLLIDASPELKEHFLKNVSARIRRDVIGRLEELAAVAEPEKKANSNKARVHKVNFLKVVLKLRETNEIQGPLVPLTESELILISSKIAKLENNLALYDDNTLTWWMTEIADWKDLAVLYYWGAEELAGRMDKVLAVSEKIKETINKHAPQEPRVFGRKEANAVARLKKQFVPPAKSAT